MRHFFLTLFFIIIIGALVFRDILHLKLIDDLRTNLREERLTLDIQNEHILNLEKELNEKNIEIESIRVRLSETQEQLNILLMEVENIKSSLLEDIEKYMHIEEEMRGEIVSEIWLRANQFNIDPFFLYAILWKESRFSNDARHKPVFVSSLKKRVRAIGMGAVIWEFWGSKLISNTSIKTKEDLKDWRKNIEATSYILSYLIPMDFVRGTNNKYESAASRYYGKYDKLYISQTLNKFKNLKVGLK